MTRLASCKAPSKSLRSYRKRARSIGSCANAEFAQDKNETAIKIQLTFFMPSPLENLSTTGGASEFSDSLRRELQGYRAIRFYRPAFKLYGLKYPQPGGGQRGFDQKFGACDNLRVCYKSFFGNQNAYP